MGTLTFMYEGVEEKLTEKQREALEILKQRWDKVDVWPKSFDLPEGYISLVLFYQNGDKIYGGMSAEGHIST